jgi:AsmA protein
LQSLQGQSEMMALTGQGDLNLLKEECDMRFNVRVLGGWKGESKLIDSSNRPRFRCVSTANGRR